MKMELISEMITTVLIFGTNGEEESRGGGILFYTLHSVGYKNKDKW